MKGYEYQYIYSLTVCNHVIHSFCLNGQGGPPQLVVVLVSDINDINHIGNLVAIAMTFEVIISKIQILHKAYQLRETHVSNSPIDTIL